MVFSRPLVRTRLSLVVFMSLLAGLLVFGIGVAPMAMALAGDLDPSFSGDGTEITNVASSDNGRGVALLPDGRIVVVGTAIDVTGTAYDFEVAIFLPGGGLDTSFSTDGKAVIDLGAADFAEAVDVMIEQPSGLPRIIVAGCTAPAKHESLLNCGTGGQFAAIKVLPESSAEKPIDTSFGTTGVAKTTALTDAFGHDVVVQPTDNKFIIAGVTTSPSGLQGRDFALARFNPDGTADTSWGVSGVVTHDNPLAHEDDEAWGVTLQFTEASAFKVVAAGQTDNSGAGGSASYDVAVTRYSSSGIPDPSFGTLGGWTTTGSPGVNEYGRDVKIQPTTTGSLPGKIMVAGYTESVNPTTQFLALRYDDNGASDTTFGESGKQVVDVPGGAESARRSEANALAIQPNRKPVLVGFSKSSGTADAEFAVARLKVDGADDGDLDPLFSTDGKLTTPLATGADEAHDAVIDENGKIVAAGVAGTDLGVARYFGDPIVFLSAPAARAEGVSGTTTDFVFTVTSSAASSQAYSILFSTSDGTATGCTPDVTGTTCDYTTFSQTVTFKANEVEKKVTVTVRGDDVPESDETLNGTISIPAGTTLPATSPSRSSAVATILNDDAARISISDPPAPIEEGTPPTSTAQDAVFTITHDPVNPPDVTTTVQYRTENGTANATEGDYVPNSGAVTFGPGESSKQVTASVVPDDRIEEVENFFMFLPSASMVNLSSNQNIPQPTITDNRGEATILDDDDKAPKVLIGDVIDMEPADPGATKDFKFVVTKTGESSEDIVVTFKTEDCKAPDPRCTGEGATVANEPADYDGRTTGTVTFAPSTFTQTQTVTVTVRGDEVQERSEIFTMTITATGAEVTRGRGTATIQDEDSDREPPPGGGLTENLGGALIGGPDVASWAPNRLDVFVIGTDQGVYHKSWNNGWSDFEDLGGDFTSDPTAVSWGNNRIDVFARGLDNALWHMSWNGSSWSGWESLGGQLKGAADVASWGPNRLDIVGVGLDDALWTKSWTGSNWSDWQSIGGVLIADPSAVSWGDQRIDVFGTGEDEAIWHASFNGSSWSGWEHLGGGVVGGPDASSQGSGLLDVFVEGLDGQPWQKSWNGSSWSGWSPIGGVMDSDPGAVSWGPGRIDIFAKGTDDALWHKWWDGSSWSQP